ncbi:Mu transposase domain-containing protein, partial [Phytoactinopolyspora endophytica]|uniref:Mu transposase domain-containing protein n=1 Tax=Phytoactinopolyspora endophytica TaxID=1642495 RepID=UPI003B834295
IRGVPASIVYDRTKTVVKRHVGPGKAVPLHPEAAAFAAHYGFEIDVLAAYRPTGKGRCERQVEIVRDHVLAGRSFDAVEQMNAAFAVWVPIRRGQVHRTHGQVIGVRAEADRAALRALPVLPYVVADQHLRRVGKDCLISFDASLYSVPARMVRAGQYVQVRASADTVAIHALDTDGGGILAVHARAPRSGSWMVDETHWDGLADGHTRATVVEHDTPAVNDAATADGLRSTNPLSALLAANPAASADVARRALSDYADAAGVGDIKREENR